MIKRIPVSELKLGMFVQELHGSWLKHPFWKTKFLLEDIEDLSLLKTCGIAEVSIDSDKSISTPGRLPKTETSPEAAQVVTAARSARPVPKAGPVTMQAEVARAQELCNQSKKAVTDMFREARMGKAISTDTAHEVVDQITASVERHPQALITLARLKTSDDYTYMHSVAVCAMMIALAKAIGIYPVGSLVRLSSQRLAVVIEQNEGQMLKPKVKAFFSLRSSLPVAQSVIDLSAPGIDDRIEARESPEKWNFPYLNDLWQSAL